MPSRYPQFSDQSRSPQFRDRGRCTKRRKRIRCIPMKLLGAAWFFYSQLWLRSSTLLSLCFKAFRGRAALRTSFVCSGIVSVPLVLYYSRELSSGSSPEFDAMWLPDPIDDLPVFELFSLSAVVLLSLCFVWVMPVAQHHFFRHKSADTTSEAK